MSNLRWGKIIIEVAKDQNKTHPRLERKKAEWTTYVGINALHNAGRQEEHVEGVTKNTDN